TSMQPSLKTMSGSSLRPTMPPQRAAMRCTVAVWALLDRPGSPCLARRIQPLVTARLLTAQSPTALSLRTGFLDDVAARRHDADFGRTGHGEGIADRFLVCHCHQSPDT